MDTSLEREPSDWNQRYLDGDVPWDKGEAAPALIEVLDEEVLGQGNHVLVPGCGYGHDARAIADAGHRVTGLDISESAVSGAKLANGCDGLVFELGDLFDPALAEKCRYDVIWEHTCFCAIFPEQRDDYVKAVHRLLQPGGVLVGVFFAFGDDESGPPFMTNIETLHRHFGECFTLEWERRPKSSFPNREGEEWLMCWRRA